LKELYPDKVAVFSSESSSYLKREIEKNFNPAIPVKEREDRINILITTDILAEGINLHRSNVIVNYDLRFALVCLGDEAKECKPEICLLYKEQVMGLIDFNSITEQRINVYAEKNCELKVDGTMSPKSKQISVKRSEIDSMIIPG
jgi:hypothetical protein